MSNSSKLPILTLLSALLSAPPAMAADRGITNTSSSPHVKLRSVDLDDARWRSGFWADRYALIRHVTTKRVEEAMRHPKNGAQLTNFEIAAGLSDKKPGGTPWGDGDCYKLLEAYAHLYATNKDPAIDRKMDYWIEVIGKAQEADGYISTYITNHKEARWRTPHRHEIYNMGHLLTAACIHHRATGKESFLRIARKAADYLYKEFQPRPPRLVHFGWNPSNIMGLMEMYRTTGDRRYIELAQIFVDNRGKSPGGDSHRGGTDQIQDRVPLREETMAVGHAVTAMYLYCGAADLYAETGEKALLDALERIWLNVTTRKMDITGTAGFARRVKSERGDPCHEAFGAEYQLPNQYNETCANIANAMWNWRLLAITGDAKYSDIIETVMYNGGLSPLSVDGKGFFYTNPLAWKPSDVEKGRNLPGKYPAQRWWTAPGYCCPPQTTRTLAKLHNWSYSIDNGGLYVHLYGSNQLNTKLADSSVLKLTQETHYPWEGNITFTIDRCREKPFAINVRIPGWADQATLSLNGKLLAADAKPGTYAEVKREWKSGDQLAVDLPMRVRIMVSHPNVEANRNKVAIMRGPIVYCFEAPLEENGEEIWKNGVFLPENITLTEEWREGFLGGVVVLNGKALTTNGKEDFVRRIGQTPRSKQAEWGEDVLYREMVPRDLQYQAQSGTLDVTMIPYYAWANRGHSYMEVWIPLAR